MNDLQPNNKNKSFKIIFIVIIIIFLIVILGVLSNYIRNELIFKNDVKIIAKLTNNDLDSSEYYYYKDYKLELEVSKSKYGTIILYPMINEANRISFNPKDKDSEYYVPGSLVVGGIPTSISKKLVEELSIDASEASNFVGVCIPREVGKYKLRFYMSKSEDFKQINNPVILCVYHNEIFGKEYSWSEIIPIEYVK